VNSSIDARARDIRLLTCDVDGVLTDGRVYMDDDGRESKAFHALDGVGIRMLADAGIAVGWITGSSAPAVAHRARLLDVRHVIQNASDKLTPWRALVESLRIAPAQCAHIGDDLPDLPIMQACGFAATVPHAPLAVRNRAHYVTMREGGLGAVRELAELILAAQGKLPDAGALRAVPGFLPRS
jgi:3-deoxy-D-manno-octulosonate 8-phosphate phosphatase (KDO 8-P phosphatase)